MFSELAFPHIRCCLSPIPSDLTKSTAVYESLSSMNQQFCSRENQLLQMLQQNEKSTQICSINYLFLIFVDFSMAIVFLLFAWCILGCSASKYLFHICFTEMSLYWNVIRVLFRPSGVISTTSLKCGEQSIHFTVVVLSCVGHGFPWEYTVAENILIQV